MQQRKAMAKQRQVLATLERMGIRRKQTAVHSPWQTAWRNGGSRPFVESFPAT
jgi:hypothetical protein